MTKYRPAANPASPSSRRDIPIVLSVGLFQMTFFFVLTNMGLGYLPAGRSAVLAYTTALWLAPLASSPARRCVHNTRRQRRKRHPRQLHLLQRRPGH